ncbi:MAG: adenosylcobinamide-GDP ribazoletransferase [Synergistales bacterium]|nr:adenosylcobinamide-GDP ribazoletransferase [Synergistales bacterium]MDN5336855.1 adenosylcobinamide-GDP ribazoletransferase [Synergistales bacterium]
MKPFFAALQFLTIIPVRCRLSGEDYHRAPLWFPVAGLLLGVIVVLADNALMRLGLPFFLTSVLTISILAALSGGLHLDGLADSADGLLSARPRERALEIMRDSRIGTMGVLALFFLLAIKVASLTGLQGNLRSGALLLAPIAGRSMILVVMGTLAYARKKGGAASIFIRHNRKVLVLWGLAWALAAGVALFGVWGGVLLFVAVSAVAILLSIWFSIRLGGFTGDTLGAASEIIEAAVLLSALFGGN